MNANSPLFPRSLFLAAVTGFLTILTPLQSPSEEDRGAFYQDGALVHFLKPAEKKHDEPIVMIPGHNLSSYIFLTTPDGRPGWAQAFADNGYEVYVINDPKFDFSRRFDVPGFEEIPEDGAPPADPSAAQGWQQDIWRRWGFGESEGNPYPDTQFPTEHFDDFEAHYPYLSNATTDYADAVVSLLEKIGPSILMPHSAGGPRAVSAALARPELVTGFVFVEPTGPPTASEFPALAGKFMLGVYGDYIDSRRQAGRKEAVEVAAGLFADNGGDAKVISLPEDYGVNGNTHLMMQDKNSDFIADLVIDWLDQPETRRPRGGGGVGGGRNRGGRGGGMTDAIFESLDTNDDHLLTEREFGKARQFLRSTDQQIEAAFDAADLDNNGRIDPGEFAKIESGGSGRRGGGNNGRPRGRPGASN